MCGGGGHMKNKDHTTHIRIEKKLKEYLDSLKGNTNISYGAIISKYLPEKRDIWKDTLIRDFKVLEEDFSDEIYILELMRMIIFNSRNLPKELREKHNEKIKLELNELSHYGLELTKEGKEREKKENAL